MRLSSRGGKTPRSLGNDERGTGKHARDVVLPPRIRPAFEVVETELALEVFVGPFDSPPLLDSSNK